MGFMIEGKMHDRNPKSAKPFFRRVGKHASPFARL
jgi:hypothetical protein